MYKLQPDDIQSMVRDAARVLTKPQDREVMQRLNQSMQFTDPEHWDRRLIAGLLAKAGKLHEAEIVAYDLEIGWQRAEALFKMAESLFGNDEPEQALGLLHAAALAAVAGQQDSNPHNRLDASTLLGDIAACYAERKDAKTARALMEQIEDPTRQARAEEKIRELVGDEAAEEPSEETAPVKAKAKAAAEKTVSEKKGATEKRSSGAKKKSKAKG